MQNNYYQYRDRMKSGDLVEFRSESPLGWAIRKVTGEDVNHSSILFRVEEYKYIRDRVFLIEALALGLEITAFSERLMNYRGSIYWYPLKASDDQRDLMTSYAISVATKRREDKQYDYPGLLENVVGRVSLETSKYFCSEIYHHSLMLAGIVPPTDKVLRPGGFCQLGVHETRTLIYQG